MANKTITAELGKFGKAVVKAAKKSLNRLGYSESKRTGRLFKSVDYIVNKAQGTVTFTFMEYGNILDKSDRYHSRMFITKAKYKKGSEPNKGPKTKGWFTDPYERVLRSFPADIAKAVTDDLLIQVEDLDK